MKTNAFADLESVLAKAKLPTEELVSGGGEGLFTQRLRRALNDDNGLNEKNCGRQGKRVNFP